MIRIFLCLMLAAMPALAQQRVGPLGVQNNLGEIAASGSSAQATARGNIGADNATNLISGTLPAARLPTVSTTRMTGSGTSGQYDIQISVTGGGSSAGHGVASYTAAQHSLNTYDGTIQFSIGLQVGATEFWQAQGGRTGLGGNFYATNGTLTGNVDGNFVAQNSGNLWFGSGSGWGLEIVDPGAKGSGNMTITGGTSTTNPSIGSTGNLDENVPTGSAGFFKVNGIVMGGWANTKSISTTANYPVLYGNSASTGMQCVNSSGSGAVTCFFQAQSTGSIAFGNSSGALGTFANSDLNTAADSLVVKAASSTTPVRLLTNGAGNIAAGGLSLAANATTGFFGIPNCVGAPTGIPALAAGEAFMCYNTASHSLNIYDLSGPGWYHLTFTAGAL